MEEWKIVKGYEDYKISSKGRVMSLKGGNARILKTFLNHRGYPRVNLMKNGKLNQVFVHRLVVLAFLGNIEKDLVVNHKDGNKQNNDVDNLEIVTQSDNVQHAIRILKKNVMPVYMLDKNDFSIVKRYESLRDASRAVSEEGKDTFTSQISNVCKGERNYAAGYSWCYAEEYNEELIKTKRERLNKKFSQRKKVKQINIETNEVIKIFDGVRQAMKETGIKNINQCTSGRMKQAGGYRWELS